MAIAPEDGISLRSIKPWMAYLKMGNMGNCARKSLEGGDVI